jgi:hypothetical protein
MTKLYTSVFIFLFVLLLTSRPKAQQSDYELTTGFEDQYAVIEERLLTAPSVQVVDSLKGQIDSLNQNYIEHSDILDVALYPDSYEAAMTSLRKEAMSAEQRLLIIESQGERLQRLGKELTQYQSEMRRMNSRADSLRKAIAESQASEERLSRLVSEYRQNLETRDELIVNVIDSLMVTYSGMSSKKMNELAQGVQSGRISGNENPLNLVSAMIDENIEYASSNNAAMNVEDHLRMYAVQNHFSDSWDQIGDRLINTYGDDEKQDWRTTIDNQLKEWKMVTSQKMWNSMDLYLEYSDVELDAFDNNYSFFVALDNFVKQAQKNSEGNILSTESYSDYRRFQDFWSGKIKNEWSNLVQKSEVLTVAQISTIDQQLSGWEEEARPIHPLLMLLFVLTGVSILGFGFAMYKNKRT